MNSAIFIISHGRAGRVKTLNLLKDYPGEIWIVVDDEDEQLEDYKALYENVLVFHKPDIHYDWLDNRYHPISATPARNACMGFGVEKGYDGFWVIDDDLTAFTVRPVIDGKLTSYKVTGGQILPLVETFAYEAGLDLVALAPNGAYLGGANANVLRGFKNSAIECVFYTRPIIYSSWTLEDQVTYNLYRKVGMKGFTLMLTSFTVQKKRDAGGLSDVYDGIEPMGLYAVIARPDIMKYMLDKHGSVVTKMSKSGPEFISERWKR